MAVRVQCPITLPFHVVRGQKATAWALLYTCARLKNLVRILTRRQTMYRGINTATLNADPCRSGYRDVRRPRIGGCENMLSRLFTSSKFFHKREHRDHIPSEDHSLTRPDLVAGQAPMSSERYTQLLFSTVRVNSRFSRLDGNIRNIQFRIFPPSKLFTSPQSALISTTKRRYSTPITTLL